MIPDLDVGQRGHAALHKGIRQRLLTVAEYGAVGDGKADDTAAVQAALNAGGVAKLTGKHRITEPLTWNPFACRLEGQAGTEIIYDATTGAAIDLTGNGQIPVDALLNVTIRATSRGTTTGIRLHDLDAANSRYMAQASFRNVQVTGFETGLEYGSYAWGNVFDNLRVYQCGTGISIPAGNVDSGERMEFVNSMIAECDKAIAANGAHVALHLSNCSLDYNGAVCSILGAAFFHQCHFELDMTQQAAGYQFELLDGDSFASFQQCRFVLTNVTQEIFKPWQERYSHDLFTLDGSRFYVTFDPAYAGATPFHRLVLEPLEPELRPRALFGRCSVIGERHYPAFGMSRVNSAVTAKATTTDIVIPVSSADWGKAVLSEFVVNSPEAARVTFQIGAAANVKAVDVLANFDTLITLDDVYQNAVPNGAASVVIHATCPVGTVITPHIVVA